MSAGKDACCNVLMFADFLAAHTTSSIVQCWESPAEDDV